MNLLAPRNIRIFYLFFRYNLDEFFLFLPALKIVYYLRWTNPWYLFSNRFIPRGQRLALALQKAGPLFVKFGQILSTRQDLFSENTIQALTQLQDNVPCFRPKQALKIIKIELGPEKYRHFTEIETKPLAAASIAQVHTARLQDGTHVILKVLRPKIQQQLQHNLDFLQMGAAFLEKYWKKQHPHISPHLLVREISTILSQEVDLRNDAAHAEQLRQHALTLTSGTLFIPRVYWEYTTKKIVTLERVYGVPILDLAALKQAGVRCRDLAKQCVTVFFTQIFHDNCFHADLHPGNIFINIQRPEAPVIELVDFGVVGSLSLKDRRYIAENMTAMMERDYRKVAQLHHESGWIPPYIAEIPFAYALKNICDPILDKPLKDISLSQLLLGLIHVAKQYEIQLQPQLLLLQKTLLSIESLCRHLADDFNLWEVSQPILKQWLQEQMGPRAVFRILRQHAKRLLRQFLAEEEE